MLVAHWKHDAVTAASVAVRQNQRDCCEVCAIPRSFFDMTAPPHPLTLPRHSSRDFVVEPARLCPGRLRRFFYLREQVDTRNERVDAFAGHFKRNEDY